jgi:nucleoside-diphosphate-sugar epimerase
MKVSLEHPVVLHDLKNIEPHLNLQAGLQGAHLLITGSTGFFGKWLLALIALLNRGGAGISVTAVSRAPERFLASYPEYAQLDWLDWVARDVQQLNDVRLPRPVDLVLHAATDTLAGAHAHPLQIFDTIINGARSVLDLAVRSGAKRVLLTGSGAQYGALQADRPVVESCRSACDSAVASSAYAEAKRAQETLAALYASQYGLEVVLTRCFAFSGPGIVLDGHFAIGNFVRDALWREELVLQSSGQSVRSYLHGADLAGWLLTLLTKGQAGAAYNVGSDHSVTIAELARRVVAQVAPGKAVRVLGKETPGQPLSYYVPDVQRARGLGLEVWTSLDASIASMARWARS